ncbi:hypothetical protein AB1Y20_007560 [Prymnesium parvum]|uniref:3'(2'),5'-bisphosphate nucleotidase 1 n=1 Tax=Prymnesium parvum TaxID=97485 RepID=A0AB34IV76_PRYPA
MRASPAAADERLSLSELLSTCVDATRRGCEAIRQVQAARATVGLTVSRKVASDPRSALTKADLEAQAAIVSSLRAAWPSLRIVGEEDEGAEEAEARAAPPLRRDLVRAPSPDVEAWRSELTLFVDPLDGTREFVEGRLRHVQCLVGFTCRGRAVGGVVGLPFPTDEAGAPPAIVYGLVGGASATIGTRLPSALFAAERSEARRVRVATGDSSNPVLAVARRAATAGGGEEVVVGGAGNKLLAAADGLVDLAVMHFDTCSWDSCAPEAIIRAAGGKVSDLFGAPLVYSAGGGGRNALGVVGSHASARVAHDALCAQMRRDATALELLRPWGAEGAAAAAADVARGIDGLPLSAQWIRRAVAGAAAPEAALLSYAAPEAGASRGMMSTTCRLELAWAAEAGLPRSAVWKRVDMAELEAAALKARVAPLKLARDVRSYAVEAAFLASAACARLRAAAAVDVAEAYAAELKPCAAAPLESRFALLLRDFSAADGWAQRGMLGEREARAALRALARLHAFFWEGAAFWREGAEATAELERAVWPSGGYWQPSMQPAAQFASLGATYREHVAAFGAPFARELEREGVEAEGLGERLQQVAARVAARAHPFDVGGDAAAAAAAAGGRAHRTLIHGDPKAANLFVRTSEDGRCEVGLIDFQWCGFGLAATDVAHHIAAALSPDCLSCDGKREAALLDLYHGALCEALVEFEVVPTEADALAFFPRELLQEQYETGLLDMCRLVFGYQWSRADFESESLNKNSYNKSLRSAVWLAARCDALLRTYAS